jgi:hypothetical protein
MVRARVFWRRLSLLKSDAAQTKPTSRRRLSTKPVICLRAVPNATCAFPKRPPPFIVRHVWTARLSFFGCRLGMPVGGGTHTMSGSILIVREIGYPQKSSVVGPPAMLLQVGETGALPQCSDHAGSYGPPKVNSQQCLDGR